MTAAVGWHRMRIEPADGGGSWQLAVVTWAPPSFAEIGCASERREEEGGREARLGREGKGKEGADRWVTLARGKPPVGQQRPDLSAPHPLPAITHVNQPSPTPTAGTREPLPARRATGGQLGGWHLPMTLPRIDNRSRNGWSWLLLVCSYTW
jgi:hypothetical protein